MSDKYVLQGHDPVPEPDTLKWGRWFQSADRKVAQDEVNGIVVSTVFLGLNHQFGEGPPLLFETITFGDGNDRCERYSTWDEALARHNLLVAELKGEGGANAD